MNAEYELVVKPLTRWFKIQRANWIVKIPTYHTAATGWDLEARRKNQDLLIEAKYIKGAFINSFAGLVCSVLSNRPQKFMKTKYRGWSHGVCWAIGSAYKSRSVLQILLDYLARNLKFWKFYGKFFKMKYVFFVDRNKITKVPWSKLLVAADKYKKLVQKGGGDLSARRMLAQELMKLG